MPGESELTISDQIFRCMVRQLLLWKAEGNINLAKRWLDRADVKIPRSPEERKRYADEANFQWANGNRGHGWIERES